MSSILRADVVWVRPLDHVVEAAPDLLNVVILHMEVMADYCSSFGMCLQPEQQ